MKKNEFEEYLYHSLDDVTDSRVKEAMLYSLTAGGKRIRPLMLEEVLEGYGIDPQKGIYFACALEMIHTYSLIHDDLPAMDNDTLRRGKPTNHVMFDEATAILAGDGLLTHAFAFAAKTQADPAVVVSCMRDLSESAGPDGMVYGQCLDMQEKQSYTFEDIRKVYQYKTGCLLTIPLVIAARLAGVSEKDLSLWKEIGYKLGLAFQIQDDILDVTKTADELGKTNSDIRNEKVTSVSTLGLKQSEELMNELYEECLSLCHNLDGFDPEGLVTLINSVIQRVY